MLRPRSSRSRRRSSTARSPTPSSARSASSSRAGGQRVLETGEIGRAARRRGPAPPRSRPAYVSAFYLPQFHPIAGERRLVGQGLHRMDRGHPGEARTSPATCSRSCRPTSASTTCACPRRWARSGGWPPRPASTPSASTTTGSTAGASSRRRSTTCSPDPTSPSATISAGPTRPGGATGTGSPARSSSTSPTARASRRRWPRARCRTSPIRATPAPTGGGPASSSTARPTCPTRRDRRAAARRLDRGRPPGGRARRRPLPRRGREQGGAGALRLLGRDAAARPRRAEGLPGRRTAADAARSRRRPATSRG